MDSSLKSSSSRLANVAPPYFSTASRSTSAANASASSDRMATPAITLSARSSSVSLKSCITS